MTARKPKFREEQMERYARHIVLPEVGGKGQRKLLDSRAAVVGAGGLGSPILKYLAAAGVGTIDVIDPEAVELSNLQRQILYNVDHIGVAKAKSAQHSIEEINPDIRVIAHETRVEASNAMELFRPADIVVDGSDNFATRYLVNDACRFLGKPLVSGAVLRFEGQVTVFSNSPGTPCYRCLFPSPPMIGLTPTCQDAGIFGTITGIIGSIQATEVLKVLIGAGRPLFGRMLVLDALEMSFMEIGLGWDRDCPLCGYSPRILELAELRADDSGSKFDNMI